MGGTLASVGRAAGAAFLSALILVVPRAARANDEPAEKPAATIPELRKTIETILVETHTPGASVAIVRRDGPEWVAGVGLADVASRRPATEDTLFRIGSVSKGFVSLAVLMLVDRSKLSLDDPVRARAPEVWFENPWESTDPIRVVHLLEHTTGWDDMHFREYAEDWPPSKGLGEAFDYDHHSRISRWRPGTRVSYCNSGPAVAAYIVEKLAGERFEDFVEDNLFRPMGMTTATYFPPPPGSITTLYHEDGTTPFPYWNILFRPVGAINASAKDMAAYLRFYLDRGEGILPASDIDRMERPASTWAAKAGLTAGYGLGNYVHVKDGFVWHGHNGGVPGGLTELGYMPDDGVGYDFSINSDSRDAFKRLGTAIRAYLTRDLPKPQVPPAAPLPSDAATYAGWYRPDSTRVELARFLERLAFCHVRFTDGTLRLRTLGATVVGVPVDGSLFRVTDPNEPAEPVATVALIPPNPDGRFLWIGNQTFRQVSATRALLELALTTFAILSMASILVYAPLWILGGLRRKRRRPAERSMRLLPLLSVLSLLAAAGILITGVEDGIAKFGNPTPSSIGFCLATLLFAALAVAGGFAAWRSRSPAARRSVRAFSIVVTTGLLIAAIYLAWFGLIGVRSWT